MRTHIGTQTIETERLILRRFEYSDCEAVFRNWASDEQVQKMYSEPTYSTLEETKGLLDKYIGNYSREDYYRWAIIDRASGENIGQIAFCKVWDDCNTAEIEYCIGSAYQGHGLAGEALSAVIRYAFSFTEFTRLEAYHRSENTRSGRVLEKSEMYITDTVQRFIREGIAPEGEICYCIEKKEFIN